MKKPLSTKASRLEASLWGDLKKALKDNPTKVCQK
jgi:hypothetical protein